MYTEFSSRLYALCAEREYRPLAPGGSAFSSFSSSASGWTLYKAEQASLCVLTVADGSRADAGLLLAEYKARLAYAEVQPEQFNSVILLYMLVEEDAGGLNEDFNGLFENAQEYFGQKVYGVFWRVNLTTREITAPDGQPKEAFGLRALAERAMREAETAADTVNQADERDGGADGATHGQSPHMAGPAAPVCVYALAFVNIIVVLLMYLDGYVYDDMTAARFGAILPQLVYGGEFWRLFTAMFVHFGYAHLLMNLFGLLVFGVRAERYFGRVKFLLIYILAGLCGSAASLLFTRGYSAGASGAIYGLVGAIFAYTRATKRSMDGLNDYIMLLYIAAGLAMGFLMPGVDNAGHIGGLLMGYAAGALAVKRAV